MGYTVLRADSGEAALELVEHDPPPIDIVITDVVLPGINGREVVEKLRVEMPAVKALFTSGYTEDVIAHHGVLDKGVQFIGKPYTQQDLARKVRQVLDEPDEKTS